MSLILADANNKHDYLGIVSSSSAVLTYCYAQEMSLILQNVGLIAFLLSHNVGIRSTHGTCALFRKGPYTFAPCLLHAACGSPRCGGLNPQSALHCFAAARDCMSDTPVAALNDSIEICRRCLPLNSTEVWLDSVSTAVLAV